MFAKWKSCRIGEVCRLINGRAFKPSDWGSKGLPIIRIQNLNDDSKPFNLFAGRVDDKHLVADGDILLSWSGTPGTSFGCFVWGRGRGVLNQHIFKVIVDNALMDRDFFVHAVNERLDEMIGLAHGGVGLRHITKGKLEGIIIPRPPLDEQRRIVVRIRKCMERVEELNGLRLSCLSEASSLVGSFLESRLKAFPLKTPSVTINSITEVSQYGTNTKCSERPSGLPILRIPNVVDGAVSFDRLKYAHLTKREIVKNLLQIGDLLVVRTNGSPDLVGRCAVFEDDGEYGYASYLIRFRLDRKRVMPSYLSYFLRSARGRDCIASIRKTSAGQFNVNSENIKGIRFPLPPMEAQQAFVKEAKRVESIAASIRAEYDSDLSPQLRGSILQKAFAGEL